MAIEPITREEKFLAKAGGQNVETPEPITRKEMFLDAVVKNGGSSGGGDCDWNKMKNKPFWKEIEKVEMCPEFVATTEYNSELGYNVAANTPMSIKEGLTYIVVFNGMEYECTAYNDSNFGMTVIGSTDFSEYPFFVLGNFFVTENAGEYTVKQYALLETVKFDYLPYLQIRTEKTTDRIPYITMEDVEKIKNAYDNGVPIRLTTNYNRIGIFMQVDNVSDSSIFASHCGNTSRGLTEIIQYQFSVEDGSLCYNGYSVSGTILENGTSFPVMYCNNRPYKINIDSSGNLKATEITS